MKQEVVSDYLHALKASETFGPQVVCHRSSDANHGSTSGLPAWLAPPLISYLEDKGIDALYTHQQIAIEHIRAKKHTVVSTPTASGKSLIYNLPVIHDIVCSSVGHALYLFPLKALAQDQLRNLEEIELSLTDKVTLSTSLAQIYDGDTTSYKRKKIQEKPPSILISNPDMLHLSLLSYHHNWQSFFQQLRYIVIDEVHTYRGVFGSHMAWVMTRLQRIANHYGGSPQFILLSATVGNPGQLGQKLTGKPFEVVTKSGAPKAKKHLLFFNPVNSGVNAASLLLEAAIKRGLRTIVYTQSRKLTELIAMWTKPRLGALGSTLSSYRAGFTIEQRREVEAKLNSGELRGVISTSALELGIDIGDLDLCILVGYPGSIMASWQRGGRVGRGQQESAVILIGLEDALDQFFMRNPDDFFSREVESAVLNPANISIIKKHLHCAAAELPLSRSESLVNLENVQGAIDTLVSKSVLLQSAEGDQYFATRRYPQRLVSLRGGGQQLPIIESETGQIIGEIDSSRAMKECHPGAVYLHLGKTWSVEKLDMMSSEVLVGKGPSNFHTKAMTNKQTHILETRMVKNTFGCETYFGDVRVTEKVTGYQRIHSTTRKVINTIGLDLPEQIIETESLWFIIPSIIQEKMESEKLHFMGAIHALEHLIISLYPLFVLCDRNDIGGISCTIHEQTDKATIFIFDGHDGGVGLCREAYGKFGEILEQCSKVLATCSCENGCPSCVHSPKCGSGNRPIDKLACIRLVDEIIQCKGKQDSHQKSMPPPLPKAIHQEEAHYPKGLDALPSHFCVFDLETQKSAAEVGGWNMIHKMGLSVGVVYDSLLNDFITYREEDAAMLVEHILSCELIIGFNNKRFDNQVLQKYTDKDLLDTPTVDLLEEISNHLGYRLSLDRVACETIGAQKTANGLMALQWYKEGDFENIIKYCQEDVKITRDLFLFGLEEGYFLFKNKAGRQVRLPLKIDSSLHREMKRCGRL